MDGVRDLAGETDGKRESRRSKPEMAIYRPGMGLLQKKSDQSGTPDAKGQNLVPGLKDLSLKDGVNGKWSGNRAKRPDQPVYTPRLVKPSEDRPTALQEGRPKAVVVDSKGPQFSTKPVPVEGTKPASEKKTEISVQKLQQHLRPESALQNGHQEHRVENKVTETGAEHPKETAKAIEVIGPPAAKQQVVVGKRYSPVGNTAAPKHINQRSDRNFARYSRRGNGRRSGPFPDTRVEENWDISDSPGTLDKPQQGVSARIPGQPVRTTPSHRRNSFSEGPRHSGSDDVDEAEHGPRRRGMKKKIKKRRNKTREDQPVVNTAVNGLPENSHHSDGNATAEEDWSGELIVESSVHPRIYSQEQVSQNDGPKKRERNNSYQSSSPEPCRFSGLKFTNRHRRESRSEEEKDKSPTLSRNGLVPAPIIKDWSAAVVEEEKRQRHSLAKTVDNLRNNSSETSTYCSNVIEVHRKNCKNDSSSQKASPPKTHESQLPPRFQKRNRPATPENTVSSAAKGGIIRLPSDVSLNGSGPAEHQCDERSVVAATLCGMGQEKPLIAVKPQPHVPVDSIYSRTMPMTLQPVFAHHFEPAPPSVMSPPMVPAAYPAVPGVQFSCHHPNQGLPTVYHGDQVIAPEMYGQRQIKPLVQKNLHDAALLERELMNHLSKGIQNMDTKAMGHCRWKLQLRYENVILADPRFCAEKNVENALWKSAFYQGIEVFRRIMEECPDFQEEVKMLLLSLVDEGTIFYENLLDKFQETYGFSLSQFLEPDICGSLGAGSSTSSAGGVAGGRVIPDSVRLVLISVQKIYICLGDLARYREQAMGTTNYGKARSWYLKAQQIAPKNGRPYNQLAILALYARRKLDAVYYYMRSLAASNPFLTARESLLALFDDARKKYDHLERKRLEEEGVNQQPSLESPLEEERLEIWIRPDGTTSHRSSRQGDQASREVEQLSLLSTIDLNKRYVLSFLHVHGKLFTKVGMETFSETARRMLMEFRCLLQRTPAAVTNSRHLQLLAINMFTVANTCLKDRNMEPDCRSLLQEQSLQVALAHVAIVLERATQLLQQSVPSPSSSTSSSPGGSSSPSRLSLSDELAELLPTLKLWTDWMSCQKRLWIPPPTPCDYNTSVKGSVWTMLADLLTVLRKLNFGDVKFFKEPAEDRELVTLPEDTTLASFVPLLGAPQEAFYVQMPCDRERARNCLRINRIQFFGDYLCGISPPYLEFNVERKRFVSLISVSDTESDSEKELTYDSGYGEVENTGSTSACLTRLQSEEELELGDSLDDQDAPLKSEEEENEIQKLRTKKEELRKAKEQHDRQQSCVHAFLQEHRSKQAAMLEIRPRFLIPDTNCFIDHLPLVQKLVADGHFNVYVPIVVLNELHGLARGGSRGPGPFPDHCEKVGSSARAALAYLEERFGQREPKLRAITIRGSILDTISFRSEDVGDYKGTNDDQILTCCRLLCNDRTEHALPREPDRPVKLYRETVLITEDRNLCVKALTHNVPVRDLPAFLRWANIS